MVGNTNRNSERRYPEHDPDRLPLDVEPLVDALADRDDGRRGQHGSEPHDEQHRHGKQHHHGEPFATATLLEGA